MAAVKGQTRALVVPAKHIKDTLPKIRYVKVGIISSGVGSFFARHNSALNKAHTNIVGLPGIKREIVSLAWAAPSAKMRVCIEAEAGRHHNQFILV
jgi:hypothetical protein